MKVYQLTVPAVEMKIEEMVASIVESFADIECWSVCKTMWELQQKKTQI